MARISEIKTALVRSCDDNPFFITWDSGTGWEQYVFQVDQEWGGNASDGQFFDRYATDIENTIGARGVLTTANALTVRVEAASISKSEVDALNTLRESPMVLWQYETGKYKQVFPQKGAYELYQAADGGYSFSIVFTDQPRYTMSA